MQVSKPQPNAKTVKPKPRGIRTPTVWAGLYKKLASLKPGSFVVVHNETADRYKTERGKRNSQRRLSANVSNALYRYKGDPPKGHKFCVRSCADSYGVTVQCLKA